jgi:threonine/homoserine/homoserine lactone efflux protein
MDWSYLPRGIVIGLSVAAPVGPMALLCIRRTLAHGRVVGMVSGVGVATADAIFGAVAAFGLTSISSFLVDIQDAVRLGGGLFLCYLGWSIARSRAAEVVASVDPRATDHAAAFASTLGLTLTNPATILSFAAIFSGFGVAAEGAGSGSAVALVTGVFAGSALWWLVLTTGTGKLRSWLTPARLTVINRACGCAILVFGVLAILSAIR